MEYNVSSSYVFSDCRDGFNHFGKLIIDGEVAARSKCHYINRTWESYDGQTARKEACRNWMKAHEESVKNVIKERLGLKRATPKVKQLTIEELTRDTKFQAVKQHYSNL